MKPNQPDKVRETPKHRFTIGQDVQMKRAAFEMPNTQATFRVIATLPQAGGIFQYRIRNVDEKYERITTEDNLQPLGIWSKADQSSFRHATALNK
jgi:hypothetical protein